MITFLSDVIKQLEDVKKEHGDIIVVTACQVSPHAVDFSFSIELFTNDSKSVELKAVVIKGYKND